MKLSSSHLAQNYYYDFICVGIIPLHRLVQSCLWAVCGCPWEVHKWSHVWAAKGQKGRRDGAQSVKLALISSSGKVTYRKSNGKWKQHRKSNCLSSPPWQYPAANKTTTPRPQFHFLSWALTRAETLQMTTRDVAVANVSPGQPIMLFHLFGIPDLVLINRLIFFSWSEMMTILRF